MAFDFPASPTDGTIYAPAGGPQYQYSGGAWRVASSSVPIATAETRNRIVNPVMTISQEFGDTGVAANSHVADQWLLSSNVATVAGARQRPAPNNGTDVVTTLISTIKPSLAATDYWLYAQAIEGTRVRDFQWGTASAKQVVLRFSAFGPAGNYTVGIRNAANDRSYLASYTLPASTWTDIVKVIPGDTAGTWPTTTARGMEVDFTYAAGTTFSSGTAGWQAANVLNLTGSINGAATTGTFMIANVGLYLDPLATGIAPPFQVPDEAQELLACRRYWYTGATTGNSFPPRILNAGGATINIGTGSRHPVTMRIVPAMNVQWQDSDVQQGGQIANLVASADFWEATPTLLAGHSIDITSFTANARM